MTESVLGMEIWREHGNLRVEKRGKNRDVRAGRDFPPSVPNRKQDRKGYLQL